jgi:hypothetical protein
MRRVKRAVAVLGLLAVAAAPRPALAASKAAADDEPRTTMHQVFDALTVLLPASLDPDRFGDPARRDAYQLAFEKLVKASKALARHGESRDAGFGALSHSLAEDADEAASRFARGRVEEAAFRLQELTGRCVACHSRLPSRREFPLADRLLGQVEIEGLPAEDRARLFVATRRFDRALAAWEDLFSDPEIPPVAMEQGGQLVDYLTVAVRVAGDLGRAEHTLRAMAARADAPLYLRSRLLRWADGCLELRAPAPAVPRLERAEALATRAQSLTDFPTAHDGLVLDLYASALLNQEVDQRGAIHDAGAEDRDLARAFWLLGVIEDRTTYSYWFPQTEAYMEAALRAAPHGPLARPAFERIEESLMVDHGALKLDDLPKEARTRLDSLAALMEETRP